MSVAELSDVGMRRSNNQDAYAVGVADSADRFQQRGHLFVVADGMGAHAAGELASQMAAERICAAYFRAAGQSGSEIEEKIESLRAAVEAANDDIHRRGQENPEFHNMGTTASSLAILPAGAVMAHVGDSRVYRLRGDKFQQMTFDHSLVWEMEASGQVHPDSALGQSIPKNVITRSLGPSAQVQVDVEGPFAVAAGDVFLLCSDGLSGQVEDEEIGAILNCLPEDEAARVLVDLANLRGGPDNSTVVIARIHEMPAGSAPVAVVRKTDPERVVSRLTPIAAVACFAGAIVLGVLGQYPTMVIAILLGIAAVILGVIQHFLHGEVPGEVPRPRGGGKAPYRTFDATPTSRLNDKLRATVDELREVADQRNWELDWTEVDSHQATSRDAIKQNKFADAVRHQAEAIIETMKQLRDQHNRSAGETDIDF